MKAKEVVREIMKLTGVTNAMLAHRMNTDLRVMWDLVSKEKESNDMSTRKLVPVLNALDYKVVVIPRDEKVPKGGYLIE